MFQIPVNKGDIMKVINIFIFILIGFWACNPFDAMIYLAGESKAIGATVYLDNNKVAILERVEDGCVANFSIKPGKYKLKIITKDNIVYEKKIEAKGELYIGITNEELINAEKLLQKNN